MKHSDDNFSQVGPLFDQMMENLGLGQRLREWRAMGYWQDAVGAKIAAKVRPVRVQKGILWVQSAHPQWANEVSLRKQEIMDRINTESGEKVIRDIRFVGAWQGGKQM